MIIDTPTLLLYLAAAWAMILIPGPDILYVFARGLGSGRRAGVISAIGVGCGECIHTGLVMAGLAAILSTSITAFLIVKYLGAVYLLYLGIKTLRNHDPMGDTHPASSTPSRMVFLQGMLTDLSNPKAILFFAAFLPQFVNPAHGHAREQILILGLLFAISDIFFLSTLAYFTGHLHRWLGRHPKAIKHLRWGTGGILIALGIRLAFTERS